MYVLTKQEVYIHIPKHNWVHNKDLQEKQMTQGVYMYILRFDKIDIYMKWKHMIIKHVLRWGIQVKMHESSKLGYTSTFNKHKWACKHKHIKVYLWLTRCTSIYPSFNENQHLNM